MHLLKYIPHTLIEENDSLRTVGFLTLYDGGKVMGKWEATSGGWKKGTILHGIYLLEEPLILEDEAINLPYKKEAFPWIVSLAEPGYILKQGRSGFAIHADGRFVGSLGCIAITKDDIMCFDAINSAYNKQEALYVEVY